ncbi:hypothetical protein, partial [Staphylococcus aureus]|uniref:hypothetical protein n=1 Tax=Staphylococcus aureus TaxID=1280 RepID=UPI001C532325
LANSQGQAIFGGEYAGHYVFNDGRGGGYDDGVYAALRVMEYLANSQGQAIFGGEYAGHYVFNDGRGGGYDDGVY